MQRLTHRRSVLALGLAVLLLAALAAPLCVMPADTAMAMPMTADQTPSDSDCDTQSSLVACQSGDTGGVPADTAKADTGQIFAAVVPVSLSLGQTSQSTSMTADAAEPPPPPGHLTPLRL